MTTCSPITTCAKRSVHVVESIKSQCQVRHVDCLDHLPVPVVPFFILASFGRDVQLLPSGGHCPVCLSAHRYREDV